MFINFTCIRGGYDRFDRLGVDLVDKLLALDPSKRLSAAEALDHPYFWHDPRVVQPSE